MTSVTWASSETIFYYTIGSDGTVTIRSGLGQYSFDFVYHLVSDRENLYLKYKTGDAILLNGFDLQYQNLSDGLGSEGIWYVSSNAAHLASEAYNAKNKEQSGDYESDFILIENSGTTFKLEGNLAYTYSLKVEYQPEKLCFHEVDFGIAVIFGEEDIPRFWINLSKDECNIENSDNGTQVYVSKLVIENAIKSYQNFLKSY